jgi:hypothetical protein
VVEVATRRLDGDVVGRQPVVGFGEAVVLLDVWHEVVRVGDRSEVMGQRGESGDGRVVAAVPGLGATSTPCRGDDLGSGLVIQIWDRALMVTIVCLILGIAPVLDVVAVAHLALHDAVDSTGRAVLTVVLRVKPQFPLLALTMTLVDVVVGVLCTPILVKVGTEVTIYRAVCRGWSGLFWLTSS